ncbi:glycosyltransferase family 4 protein [Acidihalobacter prosperus]|uniref:Glycoside hydrolase n=1 Tax=Acidihalobacter prosperus TaxID=160660 RepID=A0A1A6C1T2_9GAMM|nr:glycosyltransferase family 1 protein [Acidihalobacter prosperus]OBS08526.1 glycoside hydrolase [Acidihalobacter prosperus]
MNTLADNLPAVPHPHEAGAATPPVRLRIALITETWPPEINGVANTLRHWAGGLLERGHRIQLTRPGQGGHDRSRAEAGGLEECLVPGLPIPGYRGLRFGLPVTRALHRQWARFRPSIVYIATEGPLGMAALRVARRLGIPAITGFHTRFDFYSRHYRLGWLEPAIRAVLRRFHNRSAGTLVPTRELARKLGNEGFDNASVISRGVNTQLFGPHRRDPTLRHEWGVDENTPVALYVGRLAPEKNIALAVSTFRYMQIHTPELRFVVVGHGPHETSLRRENPDLIFAGPRIGEDLARHYASSDIFLFPSISETFGNVVLEAMASALAVVGFDYAAGREHIESGINGLLAPLGDEAAFREQAATAASDVNLLERLRPAARHTAETLDWSHITDQLEALLYEYALSDDGSPSAEEDCHASA